jgi:hypothetical protein
MVCRDGRKTEMLGRISRGCKRKVGAQGENPREYYISKKKFEEQLKKN